MYKRNRYVGAFNAVRSQVLERDDNQCVKCGLRLELEVHHIEGYVNNEPENLATLCCFCHGIAPMGRELFAQWLLIGEDGIDVIRRRLGKNGLKNISREKVIIFCTTLIELNFDTTKAKMKAARDRIMAQEGRCAGRHPYGEKIGEREILARMLELNRQGNNPKRISCILNAEEIPTRYGKEWLPLSVSRILKREKDKTALDKRPAL